TTLRGKIRCSQARGRAMTGTMNRQHRFPIVRLMAATGLALLLGVPAGQLHAATAKATTKPAAKAAAKPAAKAKAKTKTAAKPAAKTASKAPRTPLPRARPP